MTARRGKAADDRVDERGTPPPEMPAEHALLGLLVLSGGTAHGYQLARLFRRGQPLGDVIRLESAMLYKHLKKLARLGWVDMTVEEQGARPPRQVCHLTAAGRAELHRWLTEPVARTREIRLEFLVKLYFAQQLDRALAARLASEQLAVMQQITDSLAAQLAQIPETASGAAAAQDDAIFRRMVLELRREQTHAAAGWLESVLDAFRRLDQHEAASRG